MKRQLTIKNARTVRAQAFNVEIGKYQRMLDDAEKRLKQLNADRLSCIGDMPKMRQINSEINMLNIKRITAERQIEHMLESYEK